MGRTLSADPSLVVDAAAAAVCSSSAAAVLRNYHSAVFRCRNLRSDRKRTEKISAEIAAAAAAAFKTPFIHFRPLFPRC